MTMDNSLFQRALKSGKKDTAEFIKKAQSPQYLDLISNTCLDCKIPINDPESLEWIRWLIAGGESPDDFSTTVKKFNTATTCGLVWTSDTVAYRCQTCGIFPCTSLCADCFMNGQHVGHDFKMFRSQTGGACDCGDTSVVKSSGFCNKHGTSQNVTNVQPPSDLLYIAQLMAPRIFLRLILHLRRQSCDNPLCCDAKDFMKMLTDLSGMGSAMRHVLTTALTDTKIYQELTEHSCMAESIRLYENAIKSLENPDPLPEFSNCHALQKTIKHKTFLEEIIFWTVKFKFPQEIVSFLLDLLPDFRYKEAMMEAFVLHYSRIAMVLENSDDLDSLSSHVVYVSVQLFSNAELALRMTKELNLLEVMIACLRYLMSKTLTPMLLPAQSKQFISCKRHEVVDCSKPVMNNRCYWPVVSDLKNVLSQRLVAIEFMKNEMLLNIWFSFLSHFQGMNVNQRELIRHADIEPDMYCNSFIAELEISSLPMWALLSHLKEDEFSISLTKRVLRSIWKVLTDWLDAVMISTLSDDNHVTFHIPLHRYLALFICRAVNVQKLPLNEVLPPEHLIESILQHPLRIQVAFYEIMNGLWVRNDTQIQGQNMTYLSVDFCSSMVDADLYLIQILCTLLPPVQFIRSVIDKFRINEYLSFANKLDKPESSTDCDSTCLMLDSFLQFLAMLCNNRINLSTERFGDDHSFSMLERLEMTTLLCIKDRPHSELLEKMPERSGSGLASDFDDILNQIADYKPPDVDLSGNLHPGLYLPKACVWRDHYDPIHVLLRAEKTKTDFQESLDRFTAFVRINNLLPPGKTPWPPFRIPRSCNSAYKDPQSILCSRLFHSVIWVIFYKYVHEKNVTEHVLSLTVYLFELALCTCARQNTSNQSNYRGTIKREVINNKPELWFDSDDLSVNVTTIIKTIGMPSQKYPMYYKTDDSSCNVPNKVRRYLHGYPPVLPVLRKAVGQQRKCVPVALIDVDGNADMELLGADPQPDVKIFNANESIISLLLKIHSKLSGCQDSFEPDSVSVEELDSRIGDGAFFVGKVLTRIMLLNEKCRNEVLCCRAQLWPKIESGLSEPAAIDEKKRKALERQRKLMEMFALQREKFAEKNLPVSNEVKMEWDGCDSVERTTENLCGLFDCGSCRQSSFSTIENPIVLVILVQSSSVLGHKRNGPLELVLPTSNADSIYRYDTLASHCRKKIEEYSREFSEKSWQQSIDFTARGGVYLKTCGHYLHLKCLVSYVKSYCKKRGEYTCPVCRQLSNSILPIPPHIENVTDTNSTPTSLDENKFQNVTNIVNYLKNIVASNNVTNIASVMESNISVPPESRPNILKAVDQWIEVTKARTFNPLLKDCSLDQVYASFIVRSNLEIELVQRGGLLKSRKPTNFGMEPIVSCILPLIRLLSSCLGVEDRASIRSTLEEIAGIVIVMKESQSEGDIAVPLLLQDPVSLLIKFLLILPADSTQIYFMCIVKLLFNLLCLQIITEISCLLVESERNYFRRNNIELCSNPEKIPLVHCMKFVIENMDRVRLYEASDDSCDVGQDPVFEEIESKIMTKCLPFLRIATLLKHHLFDEKIPEILTETEEFVALANYLQIMSNVLNDAVSAASSLCSWNADDFCIFKLWMNDFGILTLRKPNIARNFISELHVLWKQPKLIILPHEYDRIFQYYLKKPCEVCSLNPCEGAICLVCGTLICFKQVLHELDEIPEAIQHAINCGDGTAMFLVVMSSRVVIVSDERACVWGSVYLDKYGEEDLDLKRGKPLYLNVERYQVLERQWLNHNFDQFFNQKVEE